MRVKHQPGVEPLLEVVEAEAAVLGVRALVVGGYVRDRILERDCKDLDIVVENGAGTELAKAVAARIGNRPPVIFERFGTAQVGSGDFLLEFVSARAESYLPESRKPDVRPATLEEDIQRRDFTCNTLLCGLDGEVLDLTGRGLPDIQARLLRTPLPAAETFHEDPLRAVRAIRFAVTLDFRLDDEIPPAITGCLDRLGTVVSVERINDELRKMLLSDRPGMAFQLMHQTGVLARLMPEVEAMAGVEQSGFHNLDVLDHSLAALDATAARLRPPLEPEVELALRLGVLLHDCGKPATAARDGERITFLGHPDVGARTAASMMRRLRFSNEEIAAVSSLISLHMRPIQYDPDTWSDGAVRRLVRDAADGLRPLLELARADMAASDYPPEEAGRKLGDLERRVDGLDVDAVRRVRPPLNGNQLMARFARPPGAWISRLQDALLEAVLDGDVTEGDEAAAWNFVEAHPELLVDG
ncbi:MAG TPA: HDIG domain-containing protein [Candidatus Solibacter sp.]|jgi:poly(A) polymerase|nr:HDIG domain-containing protein [Candidatus Solibacter sp.]